MVFDELEIRMKGYEAVSQYKLVNRMPVAIRIDGKAFHTFTRGFMKPFDFTLVSAMQSTMQNLCKNIQGCVLGYTQSDEITLILVDYRELTSCAWFENKVQKMCSISASMATMYFNKYFESEVASLTKDKFHELYSSESDERYEKLLMSYNKAMTAGAMFDSRAFNIPKEEVTNLIFWRQVDASRNSVQMAGHANFSAKRMNGKSNNDVMDMLLTEKGINWNDYPAYLKRGSCCVRVVDEETGRSKWIVDKEIPIFRGENRTYIDSLITFDNT